MQNTADSNYICINKENLNPKNGVLSSEALFNCKPIINIQPIKMFANSKIAIGLGYVGLPLVGYKPSTRL
jgi:hypothetical protein